MATPQLFRRDGPSPDAACVWVGGHLESSEALGQNFLEAADSLAQLWLSSPAPSDRDRLAIPIVHNYRHAIELLLKAACERTAVLIGFGVGLGYAKDVRPVDLEDKLGSTHSIAKLVDLLSTLLAGLDGSGSGELPTETKDALRYLHDLDAHGMAFRYATHRIGRGASARWEAVRPTLTRMDLENAVTQLHDAAQMIDYGLLGGYLDAYQQFLQEMAAEYEASQAEYQSYYYDGSYNYDSYN